MRNYKAEEQIRTLGLERVLESCPGLSILDIGCGEHAELVRHLRERGYNAEGLDIELKEDGMKQNISAVWPDVGCIPRDQGSYDLVIAHQNPILNESLSCLRYTDYLRYIWDGEFKTRLEGADSEAFSIIREAMRVLRETGVFVTYPAIDVVENIMQEDITSGCWKLRHKKVRGVPRYEQFVENGDTGQREDCSSALGRRTIIYRAKIDLKLKRSLNLARR